MKTIMKTYHFLELLLGLDDALPVVAVHDEDESLGVLEVVPPQGADLVLTAHIPHSEADVFVFYRLHIETCGGKCYTHDVTLTGSYRL